MIDDDTATQKPRKGNGTATTENVVDLGHGAIKNYRVLSMWNRSTDLTPPDWLVNTYLEKNTLSGLFAPPSKGKSMIALDIAACIVTGNDWHDYKVKQGIVFYIAGEGSAGLKKRLKGWRLENDFPQDDFPLFMCDKPINGQSRLDVTCLCEELENVVDITQQPVNLVIVDTVARNFGDGDENSARDMNIFINNMDYIRQRWGCAVLLVHHTGHAEPGRPRGSSSFTGALDAEYVVRREGEVIEFKSTKMKDAETPEPINFELKTVDLGIVDEDGTPITSAIVNKTDKAMPEQKTKPKISKLSENYASALGILRGMYSEYRSRLKNSGRPASNATVEYGEWRKRCLDALVCSKKHWDRVPRALEKRGLIIKNPPHVFLVDETEL